MDEPTNDLDADTLDLLEELLIDYTGTVLVVSHDRAFLNNLVTSVLAYEGDGVINEYIGGYDDWVRQRPPMISPGETSRGLGQKPAPQAPEVVISKTQSKGRKMSFKEMKELESLPSQIESLERSIERMTQGMANPDFYQQAKDLITAHQADLALQQKNLETAYGRWEELEALRNDSPPH